MLTHCDIVISGLSVCDILKHRAFASRYRICIVQLKLEITPLSNAPWLRVISGIPLFCAGVIFFSQYSRPGSVIFILQVFKADFDKYLCFDSQFLENIVKELDPHVGSAFSSELILSPRQIALSIYLSRVSPTLKIISYGWLFLARFSYYFHSSLFYPCSLTY